MRDEPAPAPTHGFRRRLTAAFVLTAAISSGALAVLTYELAREYRGRSFRQVSVDEARVALALAPDQLDDAAFDRLLRAYETRTRGDVVARIDGRVLSSSATLDAGAVLDRLPGDGAEELQTVELTLGGRDHFVVVASGPGGARYAFVFPLAQVEAGLSELRTVLAIGWVGVVAVSVAVGQLVARRTLRPVREAAEAASALSAGLLHTRLPSAGNDEFGAWAASFNSMAAALEAKIDQLSEAAARERRFTADVSHDLRTPLTGMAATAALLEDHLDELPEPSRRAVAVLLRDVARFKELVLELLELSRLDAGAEQLHPEPLVVAHAVRATADGMGGSFALPLRIDVPLEVRVLAERVRLRRVVGNLLANAVAHGAGEVRVTVEDHDGLVGIVFCDDGPGILAADLERVFDRFFKSDRSRASGGSGLGLAIAREHARALGGDLVAGNRAGGGARFTLLLPAAEPGPTGPAPDRDRSASAVTEP